ncbi:hypothetical protein SAMN05421858_0429 [Haladaptatus litoreus]|uniref:DUF8070 domain-containing protein n=1 Tax=Haladaptatus litoreus TaxID=553468 RepID=A0A1N6VPI4_9EURY|nr:hypothetical protein [Haladaptatus litoreus]SIQ79596.1 hypothetical protein SAMN05421858_0429 [Haladaptatus litoreus]
MNWNLIGRCGVRYTLVYAGLTVALTYVITQSGMVLLCLFGLGLVALLFALGGTGTVRMGTAMTNADSMGISSTIVDPADTQAKAMDGDIKVLFYGIGLLAFAAVALVLSG